MVMLDEHSLVRASPPPPPPTPRSRATLSRPLSLVARWCAPLSSRAPRGVWAVGGWQALREYTPYRFMGEYMDEAIKKGSFYDLPWRWIAFATDFSEVF